MKTLVTSVVERGRMSRYGRGSAVFVVGLACLSHLLPAWAAPREGRASASPEPARLVVNDCRAWTRGADCVLASVSVKDSGGNWVIGLPFEDFQLTEALLSPSGDVLQERTITFGEPVFQFGGPGFWERSVTAHKLDYVFVVDCTWSMEDEMPAIRSEVHDFVSHLQSNHVDFRVGGLCCGWSTPGDEWSGDNLPLCGPMEADLVLNWIDHIGGWGEWWEPTACYDATMLASQFGLRPDARKIIVVITDTVPQTPYGNY